MKVLHVINSMIVGGAETLLKDAIISIHQNYPDVEQHLITLYGGGKLLEPVNDFVKYINLHVKYSNFICKSFQLREYIKKNKIDIVHAHLYDAMIFSRIGCPKNIKLFYTYHNGIHNQFSTDYSFIRKLLDKLTYRKGHRPIYVSNTVKKEVLEGVNITGESYVLTNFTSTRFTKQYKFKEEPSIKLVTVGNLRKQKNQQYAVDILSGLKGYPISLDIYSSGGMLREELEDSISKTGAKVKIITDKILTSEILAEYDCFFMSSTQEGMSIALLEAMASGLPSLLSNIESFQETAMDAAWYFDLNDPAVLQNQLIYMLNNKKVLLKLSEKAGEKAENYSLDTYLKKLFELYNLE